VSISYESPLPAARAGSVVCEMEPPVIRESFSPDGEPNLDDFVHPGVNALLSMADLPIIDTRRIGWLLSAHQRFHEAGGRMVLHSVRLRSRETLEFLRLDRVLDIAKDEAAALESLRTSSRCLE